MSWLDEPYLSGIHPQKAKRNNYSIYNAYSLPTQINQRPIISGVEHFSSTPSQIAAIPQKVDGLNVLLVLVIIVAFMLIILNVMTIQYLRELLAILRENGGKLN